jgi:hypothetical protein
MLFSTKINCVVWFPLLNNAAPLWMIVHGILCNFFYKQISPPGLRSPAELQAAFSLSPLQKHFKYARDSIPTVIMLKQQKDKYIPYFEFEF